jgi:hypothetical protein
VKYFLVAFGTGITSKQKAQGARDKAQEGNSMPVAATVCGDVVISFRKYIRHERLNLQQQKLLS